MTTMAELILQGAHAHCERTALTFQGQHVTFAEVDHQMRQIAAALMASGIEKGEPVAVLLDNGLHSLSVDFGLSLAGINRIALNTRLSESEHRVMLEQTGCRAIVAGAALMDRAQPLAQMMDAKLLTIGAGGAEDALAFESADPADLPAISEADVLFTLFTSGTTGTLKAAVHTHGSGAAICQNVLNNLYSPDPEDSMLHAASLIHASGAFVLPFWLNGARTVVMPSFEPAAYLRTIEEEAITAINVVPTMLHMVMRDAAFPGSNRSSVKRIIYGASPMPRKLIESARATWPQADFWQYYGQTEMPLCISVLQPQDHNPEHLGSCGQISSEVELRLVDEKGGDVPQGEPGEILVRGPNRMQSYHAAEELNRETLLPDGWMRTRDIGRLDEHGFLTLIDRTSDMIISGGYNVYPREVEDVLEEHPAIVSACVVGVPDETWVEAVAAVVVLEQGATASEAELTSFVVERLASHKKPRHVAFWNELPRTAVGKLDRKAVRAAMAQA